MQLAIKRGRTRCSKCVMSAAKAAWVVRSVKRTMRMRPGAYGRLLEALSIGENHEVMLREACDEPRAAESRV